MIEKEPIEDVWKLKYIGSMIAPDTISQNEINIRLALAKGATSDLNNIWHSKKISQPLKVKLAISLIWSIAAYECEKKNIRKEDERKINALEMWIWKGILQVTRMQCKTNEWVRQQVKIPERCGQLQSIVKRKKAKYG